MKVFARILYELSNTDPSFICHSLNVDEKRKLIIQCTRRLAPAHSEAVIKVDRLLEAEAKEVQYPNSLANTVVVKKKKNDKWSVCVDYYNLNDACPKDYFPYPESTNLWMQQLGTLV